MHLSIEIGPGREGIYREIHDEFRRNVLLYRELGISVPRDVCRYVAIDEVVRRRNLRLRLYIECRSHAGSGWSVSGVGSLDGHVSADHGIDA